MPDKHAQPNMQYALIGFDAKASMRDSIVFPAAMYQSRPHARAITPQAGDSATDIARQIHGPATIFLDAHGWADGSFTWNQGQQLTFEELFHALPRRGIGTMVVNSCFGSLAMTDAALRAAPRGAVVLSQVEDLTWASVETATQAAKETVNLHNPIDLYIKILDNFHTPADFKSMAHTANLKTHTPYNISADAALPKTIGIAGEHPDRIDMDEVIQSMHHTLNRPALQRAEARVQRLMDTDMPRGTGETLSEVRFGSLGQAAENALDQHIHRISGLLARGFTPTQFEDRRLAYALAAAYVDETGQLQQHIDRQIKKDAFGHVIDATTPPHAPQGLWDRAKHYVRAWQGVTGEEQAYINSVAAKLSDDATSHAQTDRILAALVKDFTHSNQTDTIHHGLSEVLRARGIVTQGWER